MKAAQAARRVELIRAHDRAAEKIANHVWRPGYPGHGWLVKSIATLTLREHDRADRAMQQLFRRLARCQKTRRDGGVCGECLLAAVEQWRRATALRRVR